MAQTAARRVKSSGETFDYTPSQAVAAGAVIVLGSLVAIATSAIEALVKGALAASGIFYVPQGAVTFTLGQAVYWDADGSPVLGDAESGCAVESATGNTFMGYALGATEATDEYVLLLLRSAQDAAAETLSLADLGDVGAILYTAGRILVADGDSFEDVAVSGDATLASTGALTLTANNLPSTEVIADPGNTTKAIPVTNSGSCPLVSVGAAETRTLADPTFAGQVLNLCFKTDGGDITITAASPINQTANNTMLFEDVGDNLVLIGCNDGADIEWRVLANDGVTLTTV